MIRPQILPTRWITHAAFVLALAVMIARITTPDVLRDPWEPTPGAGTVAAGPGAATGLVFDLLASLPAVLVLIRSALDREFQIIHRWSYWPLFALAAWAAVSTAWSSDRFAAAVTSAHFVSASCLLWAMSQLVRSGMRFRVVSSVAFGLLLVLVAQSVMYRFVDVPENISYWNEKKSEILMSHGWEPDSFAAKQFEHKLISGELVGFFNSENSFAAVGVLLFAACIGIGVQKVKHGEKREWLAMPAVAVIALLWILINAKSKTSAATPFIGAIVLGGFIRFRRQLRQRYRDTFFASVGLVLFAMIAVVGHGLYHHGLFPGHFSNSLDFRWKYWVASVGIFKTHPVIGVGWSNFGLSYLAHRLPEAAEEIKDPHNFLVRFFVELGVVGGLLSIAWLLRLAWEITQPSTEPDRDKADNRWTIKSVIALASIGMFLNIAANIDFSLPAADTLALLMKPVLYLLALLLGAIAGSMRSPHEWSLDARPTPWIFYGLVTGLGLFLLHNLIDFSWFEAGAMAVFMGLFGSALGMAPTAIKPAPSRTSTIVSALAASSGWLAVAVFFAGPVLIAEQFAGAANDLIQSAPAARSEESISHYRQAADDLSKAAALVPYNADYVFRQAQAILNVGDYAAAQTLLAQVKQINPMLVDGYLLDANLRLAGASPDQSAVRADFDTILKLNPNDVQFHIQYRKALERFGADVEALQQYKMALDADAALPIGEPKRLSAEQVSQLKSQGMHGQGPAK